MTIQLGKVVATTMWVHTGRIPKTLVEVPVGKNQILAEVYIKRSPNVLKFHYIDARLMFSPQCL